MSKFVFIGSVELSQMALEEFINQGLAPELVVTLKPELSGRHSDFSDLASVSANSGIPVQFVRNINEPELIETLTKMAPDYIFVIGWSQLIKTELLNLPSKGCIGFHFAKLPRNRGRAAIPWVILNEETETGVTFMHLDEGVDSGDIVCQRSIAIAQDERARTLYDKVCAGLQDMVREVSDRLKSTGELPAMPQNADEATYLAKRTGDDGWIDWNKPAREIERLIRAAGEPYPGAFTIYRNQKLIIWDAKYIPEFNHIGTIGQVLSYDDDGSAFIQCGEGWIKALSVEIEGGNSAAPPAKVLSPSQERLGLDIYQIWKQLNGNAK